MEPTKRPKRVTITDVAARAGVSTAAVSKVLRNAYGVSPAMQERVRAAMAELDYRPHAAARGMRGRTYTIGVLLDSLRNTFFADILDGVQQQLSGSDYTVLIGAAGFGASEQARTVQSMVVFRRTVSTNSRAMVFSVGSPSTFTALQPTV